MAETYPDEADAADDVREEETSPPGAVDAPEADALEQATPVRPRGDDEPETVGDHPEADALEQARGVGDEEDDERR